MSRVGIVQMHASARKADNARSIARHIARAASLGCDLVAFPEYAMFAVGSRTRVQVAADAERIDGAFVSGVLRAAREHGIHVVCTMCEAAPRSRVYDTAFLATPSGRLAGAYRKTHLYDALGVKESALFARGSRLDEPRRTPAGRVAMMVCYDLRFPEVSRSLAAAGSDVLVAPSAWFAGPGKIDQWIAVNKVRAIENGCYVIAPDQVGAPFCGRSLAVAPDGSVLLDMGARRGVGTVEVSPDLLRSVRRSMPLMRHRRTDLYHAFG